MNFTLASFNPRAAVQRWREAVALRRYTEGYRFAAGALVAGETADVLLAKTQEARDFDEFTPFDRGVEEACKAWRIKMRRAQRR